MAEFFQSGIALLLVPLAVAAVGALCYFGWRQAKQRREALAAFAGRLGLSYDRHHDRGHDELYNHFEIFCKGHSRSAYNTIQGQAELAGRLCGVRMGDYTYKQTSHNGKNTTTTTYRFSYLIVHLPWPHCPDLLIRKEGLFDKLASFVGFDDIDFESAEFSKRFCVKSKNKRFAYDVVDPRMMEFLLAGEPSTPLDIERGRLCMSDGRSVWKPERFERELAYAAAFLERWPEHAVRSLEEQMDMRSPV